MKRFITILTVSLALLTASYALAADVNLVYKPPCLLPGEVGTFGPCIEATSSIAQYLLNLYRFGMGIAGILAVGMIVGGSVYMSISSSSIDKKSEGREMITSALIGIGLLFGSYILLNTINPELIKLKDPAVKAIVNTSIYHSNDSIVYAGVPGCPEETMNACTASSSFLYTKYSTTTLRAAPGTQTCLATAPSPETGLVRCLPTTLDNGGTYAFCSIQAGIKSGEYFNDCMGTNVAGLNLRDITSDFDIQTTKMCQWGSAPKEACKVSAPDFYSKLIKFRDSLKTLGIERKDWRVTEAFPPTIHHADSCHIRGTCIDVKMVRIDALGDGYCGRVQKMIDTATNVGLNVVNEYSVCPDTTPVPQSTTYATGSHLHLEN